MTRIDYMPGEAALAVISQHQAAQPIGGLSATNSAVIDSIVLEWARLKGARGARGAGRGCPEFPDASTRARKTSIGRSAGAHESDAMSGITAHIAGVRAGAYESGRPLRSKELERGSARVRCGAKRHRDGQPCQAMSEPGKRRCRFHGGRSTGPRTPEGKARALANLRQFKPTNPGGPDDS